MSYILHVIIGIVESPNKGHFRKARFLFWKEAVLWLRETKYIRTIGRKYFGTSSCVLCREVDCTVSLFGRVHYRRSHCTCKACMPNFVHVWGYSINQPYFAQLCTHWTHIYYTVTVIKLTVQACILYLFFICRCR